MERTIEANDKLVLQEQSNFVRRVNHVVDLCLGPIVEESKISFDLDYNCQSHIDKWLVFTLAKQVKRLALDFEPASPDRKIGPVCNR